MISKNTVSPVSTIPRTETDEKLSLLRLLSALLETLRKSVVDMVLVFMLTAVVTFMVMVILMATHMVTGTLLTHDDVTCTVMKDILSKVQTWRFVTITQVSGKCCQENALKMSGTQMSAVLLHR